MDVEFKPSIVRNIEIVRKIGASLNLDVDPLGGDKLKADEEKSSLVQQIELTNLQTQLELQKVQLQLAKDGGLKKDDLQANGITVNEVAGVLDEAAISSLTADVNKLSSELADLKESLSKKQDVTRPTNPASGDDAISAAPIESFRDQLAYRSEIRQTIEETRLDDTHDIAGGVLYKMQFDVMVLPGKEPDKWAMAKISPVVAEISDEQYKKLYAGWLRYLNSRLQSNENVFQLLYSEVGLSSANKIDALNIRQVGKVSKLYRVVDLILEIDSSCKDIVSSQVSIPFALEMNQTTIAQQDIGRLFDAITLMTDCGITLKQDQAYVEHGEKIQTVNLNIAVSHCSDSFAAFKNLLIDNLPSTVRVYAVGPLEKNQQIASVASTANAIDLAFGLKQKMSGSGLGGAFGSNFSSNVAARHEAIERLPRVVSFSSYRNSKSSFGWVLGPKARISGGGNKLELYHTPEAHKVYVNLIVPPWAPEISLKVRSAWIKNWEASYDFESDDASSNDDSVSSVDFGEYTIPLKLDNNQAGMSSLTEMISNAVSTTFDNRSPLIRRIDPGDVLSCSSTTSIAIHGFNLWRDTEVYMKGVRSERVRVLPGMRGVVADFNMRKLFDNGYLAASGGIQAVDLEVFTRHGRDHIELLVQNGGGTGACLHKDHNGTETLTLEYAKKHFFIDAPLFLGLVKGQLPKAHHRIDLYLRKKGHTDYKKVGGTISVGADTVKPAGAALSTLGIVDGDMLEAYLMVYRSPSDVGERVLIPGAIPAYLTKPTVAMTPAQSSVLNFPASVYLDLPQNWQAAFPEFEGASSLSGRVSTTKGALVIDLERGSWPVKTPGPHKGSYELRLSLTDSGDVTKWQALPKAEMAGFYLGIRGDVVNFNTITLKNN